ncbi:MAG: Hint domain-containing protein [Litoreibacter sp.]|nr:Hint domain-containing protein [Litoreibacter sp.]
MGAGFGGTYVLSMTQTTLDGAPALPGRAPRVGQDWRWQGAATRLDGSQSILTLDHPSGQSALRARVAKTLERRFDLPYRDALEDAEYDDLRGGFIISDGAYHYLLVPILTDEASSPLLWCPDGVPFAKRDYEVSYVSQDHGRLRRDTGIRGDVICFTAGTSIATERGAVPVEHLGPGDTVLTRDNGAQEITWVGSRRISGARLHVLPELRPVRIRAGALEDGAPDQDLLVSPHHRMLFQGDKARALFNEDEVLIRAADMVDDHKVMVDHTLREVVYYHLLFDHHQIVWANGVPSESFHPAQTSMASLDAVQRDLLYALRPELELDAHHYGPSARRNLTQAEAAILLNAPH